LVQELVDEMELKHWDMQYPPRPEAPLAELDRMKAIAVRRARPKKEAADLDRDIGAMERRDLNMEEMEVPGDIGFLVLAMDLPSRLLRNWTGGT